MLVVVAIIGILAAVGVVAYNGYTASAKTASTKTIHSQVVKYLSAELQKCNMGELTSMDGQLDCSKKSEATTVQTAAVTALASFKNPYSTASNAVRSSASNTNDADAGFVSLSASGATITIKSCHKDACSTTANRQESKVSVE